MTQDERIKKAKTSSKPHTREQVIAKLRESAGRKQLYAIYRHEGSYRFITEKYGPVLYDHALMQGHTDPDFLGFYGRFGGWKYFSEDTAVEVAA